MYEIIKLILVIQLHAGLSEATTITQGQLLNHLSNEYTSLTGQKIYVFDQILPQQDLLQWKMVAFINDKWRFVLNDEYNIKNENYDDQDGIAWKAWQDPALLSATKAGSNLKSLVQAVDEMSRNITNEEFSLNEIYSAFIRRGDRTRVFHERDVEGMQYTVAIYENVVWRKNNYGETLFYDEDGEIFAAVRAKFGRVVVWDSSISCLFRPPSITQISCQHIVFAKFSMNVSKNIQKREYFRQFVAKQKHQANQQFVCTNNIPDADEINVEDHLVMEKENKDGHKLAVYDGLFPEPDLHELRSWSINHGRYFFDDSLDLDSDNVQWIAGFTVKNFVKSRFWPIVRQLAEHLSGKDDWYPYDVACNLIRSYDHTRIHRDTSLDSEEEITFLLYLNPNWTAADYGETAFMQMDADVPNNQYVAEVVPYFGRAVVFDGDFPHSARPPSVNHYGPRHTFAVKLSPNKKTASHKMLLEEFRHEVLLINHMTKLKKLVGNSEKTYNMHKVKAVLHYLKTRKVQSDLDLSLPQHEVGNPVHTKESEELYRECGIEDDDLAEKELKIVQEMLDHYQISNDLNKPDDNGGEEVADTMFDISKREERILQWIESFSWNPDMLGDYLELYLKQQAWLKELAKRKMYSLL